MNKLKKLLLVCTLVSYGITVNAQKFDPTSTKNNFKIGLNNTYFENDNFDFGIAWEFKITKRQSLQIGLLPILSKYNDTKRNGFGLSLNYRKYISKNKEGLQGLYFSPGIKFGILNKEYSYTNYIYTGPGSVPIYATQKVSDKFNSFNASLLFGRQWVYKSGFSLDISGGLGIYSNKFTSNRPQNVGYPYYGNSYYEPSSYGISPNLNITIGYAF